MMEKIGEEGKDEVERLGTMTERRHEVETCKAYNMMGEVGEKGIEDAVERLGTMTERRHEVNTCKTYNMMEEVGEKGIEDEVYIEQMGPCHQVNFVGINVGDRFASIKVLSESLLQVQDNTYVQLWTRDSRTLKGAKRRYPLKAGNANLELKYYSLSLTCSCGGRNHRRKQPKGKLS